MQSNAVGQTPLPDCGLLQFFGDHDDINSCMRTFGRAVIYFTETQALEPAHPPVEPFVLRPRCGLTFYDTAELPDPFSNVVTALRLSATEAAAYEHVKTRIGPVGAPDIEDKSPSRLFGWPDLIQCDLGQEVGLGRRAGEALLLQIG